MLLFRPDGADEPETNGITILIAVMDTEIDLYAREQPTRRTPPLAAPARDSGRGVTGSG